MIDKIPHTFHCSHLTKSTDITQEIIVEHLERIILFLSADQQQYEVKLCHHSGLSNYHTCYRVT